VSIFDFRSTQKKHFVKDQPNLLEEFEDTKEAIRICILKKNRQHTGQKKKYTKDKQRSTKHTYKTKDRVTRTPLKTGGELGCSGRVSSSW